MGISKLLSEATSYWPAWLENSWLILSRTSFSGSTVKFTWMPVVLVKLASVGRGRALICGLLTMRTLMVSGPPPPGPPPQPAHPAVVTTSAAVVVRARRNLRRNRDIGPPRRCCDAGNTTGPVDA